MQLSTAQRETLRQIGGTLGGKPHGRSVAGLRKRGMVDDKGELTAAGRRAFDYVMSSGDGPEGLKAMFRF